MKSWWSLYEKGIIIQLKAIVNGSIIFLKNQKPFLLWYAIFKFFTIKIEYRCELECKQNENLCDINKMKIITIFSCERLTIGHQNIFHNALLTLFFKNIIFWRLGLLSQNLFHYPSIELKSVLQEFLAALRSHKLAIIIILNCHSKNSRSLTQI